jgi:agmatinase
VTFLGLPTWAGEAPDVVILGAPRSVDYPNVAAACADGPAAIRRRSQRLAGFVDHWDFDLGGPMLPGELRVVDGGDVAGPEAIERAVGETLAARAVPVVLGGDDSVPIPVLRAFASAQFGAPLSVLQVDAHLDFRDEVHGVRDGYSSPMRRASEMGHVGRIVQVGLRGPGSARAADVDDARAAGNALLSMADLRARGGAHAVAEQLPQGVPLFVSFDLDALDPSVAPGVRAVAPGGLSYPDACELIAAAAARAPIVGAAFTEYAPALDVDDLTALVAVRLVSHLLAAIGRCRS